MTKHVRIENADTGEDVKVVVQVWDRSLDGSSDMMAYEQLLGFPTAMTDICVTSTRYLIVKEI